MVRSVRTGPATPAVELAIRAAELPDARRIAEVHVRVWRAAYRGIVPDAELKRLSVRQREEMWRRVLSADPQSVLAMTDGDLIVGWAAFGPTRDPDGDRARTRELHGIYLLKRYWGSGQGQRLYREVERRLRLCASEVILWVFEANGRARRFYERLGFEVETNQRKAWIVGEVSLPVVRYRKTLVGPPA